MLRIRVCGDLELEANGEALAAPPGRRARELLCYLALEPGPHARGELASRFWPDVLEESSRASLRTAVHELRRALGDGAGDWLISTRERVGLAENAVSVDAHEVASLAADGHAVEALELCRGELLGDLDSDWALRARDDHRELVVELHERLAAEAEAQGDLEAALRHTREQATLDPLSEEAHRRLMRRLAVAGDRPTALTTYGRLEERLRKELGVAPSEPTRELAEELRTARVADGAAPDAADAARGGGPHAQRPAAPAQPGGEDANERTLPVPPALRRRHRSPFVGRGEPLSRLRGAWERARDGDQQLWLVDGDPGIGKTRLVAELARTAHAEGTTVLYGRCQPEGLAPYEPFAEALRPYIAATERDELAASAGVLVGELVRLCPDQADRLPELESPVSEDPAGARYRLFEAASALLDAAQPALVALEDLHWADRATLLMLRHLARSEPRRLLIVGTYRRSELARSPALGETLAELRRERVAAALSLDGLRPEDIGSLVASWLGADAPGELAGALAERTDGNPFFCEEVLHELGASRAAGRLPTLVDLGVPQGVKEVLGHRLSSLGGPASEALVLGAVVGREFDLELLVGAGDLDREAVVGALDEALAAHLVREEPGRAGRYSFPHALVREAIYDEPYAARRALLHARVGEALEGIAADDVNGRLAELAHHFLSAGDVGGAPEKGVDYARRAGYRAMSQLAYEEAAAWFERALGISASSGEDRCDLLLALANARLRGGDVDASRESFAAAAKCARELDDATRLARAALGYSGLGVAILEVDQAAVDLLEEALAGLADGEDSLRAGLLARLAVELYYAPSRDRSETLSAEAFEAARRSGDQQALSFALNARHVALWRPDRLDERLELAREMLDRAEGVDDRETALQARNWLVADLFEAGDIEAFEAEVERHAELAEELRLPAYHWYAPIWRGASAALGGRLAEAEALAAACRGMGERIGDANAELYADILLYMIAVLKGDFEGALANARDRDARRAPGDASLRATYLPSHCWLAAAIGEVEDAGELFAELRGIGFEAIPFDANWPPGIAASAEACARLGAADAAAEVYERLAPFASMHVTAARAAHSYGSAARHLGLLAATMERWADAEAHFEAALKRNAALGSPPWVAWTQLQYAEMLLARNAPSDRERAGELLAAARAAADELGLDGLAERAGLVTA